MAGINMMGSYSGIDKNTIDQLMAAEKMPLVKLASKKTSITEKQNAWKDVNTRLNTLSAKIKALQNKDTFTAKSSTSTNDKNVSMIVGNNAAAGTYKISVGKLATNSSVIFGKSDMASIGDGKYSNTKELGLKVSSFTIGNKEGVNNAIIQVTGDDSLQSIVNKINDTTTDTKDGDTVVKGTGISATIVDNRLVLTDTKTGNRNITLTPKDSLDETLVNLGLNVDDKVAEGDKKSSIVIGNLAEFKINGIDVKGDSNTVTGVIEGVTINLTKVTGSGEETITIAQDDTVLTKAVQEFVDQYNSTMKFIEDKLKAGDPKVEGTKGALAGDSSLMRLHSSLRNLVTDTVTYTVTGDKTKIKDISQLGVSTIDKFGQLQFDSSKLTKALSENPQKVMDFFTTKDIGFASKLEKNVNSFISTKDGTIKGKTESFDKSLKDLNKQIDAFSARMEKKEAYYIKKFTALDVALMQAESQMSWLQGQVDSMNGIKR